MPSGYAERAWLARDEASREAQSDARVEDSNGRYRVVGAGRRRVDDDVAGSGLGGRERRGKWGVKDGRAVRATDLEYVFGVGQRRPAAIHLAVPVERLGTEGLRAKID